MKVLWITNIPIGDMASKVSAKPMGGLWMDALLNELKIQEGNSYVVVTSANVESVQKHEINGITYYLMPGGLPVHYKRNAQTAKAEWHALYAAEKPDVIQVWGTEYSHAVPALQVAKEAAIPSVIYIQGIMKAIAKYATGELPFFTALRYTTLRDIYRWQLLVMQKRWFRKRIKTEETLVRLSGNVVVENEWSEAFCKALDPNVKAYRIPLNINEEFFNVKWDAHRMERHAIMCNAAGSAYKGVHVLLNALVTVKEKYPDVKLYIPGNKFSFKKWGLARQKVPGYWVYISDLIRKNGLRDNVVFTGYLNRNQMSELLSKVNLFVLPSVIENHSSSLKEAMAVGTPSVTSLVGGIPEYYSFGECGYSYREGEHECLAHYICKLFGDDGLCRRFSENSRKKSKEMDSAHITELVLAMYTQLADGGRKQ